MNSAEHLHNIFSTPIWGYTLTNEQYAAADYIEYIEELATTEPSQHKSNSGGWQSKDDLHKHGIFREFVTGTLQKISQSIVDNYSDTPATVQSMWANINYTHSFNFHHTHEGVLSGVFYLQTPTNSGRLVFTNPAIRSHNSIIKSSNYAINPSPLACIIFPSWLEHYVEPNLASTPRISISFNIDIT